MPRPPAKFELYRLYKGEVELKFFPNSQSTRYKIYDAKNKRAWEASPSVTGLTGNMDKGIGLMVYAMSESMKYIDRTFTNKSIKNAIEDEKFTLKDMYKAARSAHIEKSSLGKRVGTASHDYVEKLLRGFKSAQDKGTQFIVPPVPLTTDIAGDLRASWEQIIDVYSFKTIEDIEKYRAVLNTDIEVRGRIWQETLMVQRACSGAKEFFTAAGRQGALKVWAVEQLVHSRKYFYSGRFDCILEFVKPFTWRGYTIAAGVYICDFKTSNPSTEYLMGIFPNHLAQIGGYDVAYCEEFPEVRDKIKGHLILGSSKHGEGFHPYVSLKRERNRDWAIALVPVAEYMHQADKELKGLNLYGGNTNGVSR